MEIRTYEEQDRDQVIQLVLHCQNDGSRPLIGLKDQPDLLHIPEAYMSAGGCFWVAKENGRVVGSIGLMRCEGEIGILKKFFVDGEFRGKPYHLGRQLYKKLLAFAEEKKFRCLLLDTPKNTVRAHRFYEQAGFVPIPAENLPVRYHYPYSDSDFFLLELS